MSVCFPAIIRCQSIRSIIHCYQRHWFVVHHQNPLFSLLGLRRFPWQVRNNDRTSWQALSPLCICVCVCVSSHKSTADQSVDKCKIKSHRCEKIPSAVHSEILVACIKSRSNINCSACQKVGFTITAGDARSLQDRVHFPFTFKSGAASLQILAARRCEARQSCIIRSYLCRGWDVIILTLAPSCGCTGKDGSTFQMPCHSCSFLLTT